MDTITNDELLWQGVRKGDRDAFGQIVERYQSLVCSVAYAGLGEVAGSQDVAQEAFVAAWRQRDDLREPARLRAWLCGIARTMTANIRRKDRRRGGVPDSLDLIQEPATTDDDPLAQAVSREEEVLLWRAIRALPESYRESLVLFYREDQSIAQVAIQLDLSQETVKQRLSRGRSMLRAELASVVESALSRSRPGPGFTAGVLAAIAVSIPATSTAAVVGTVVASSAKGAGVGAGAVVGSAAGVMTTWIMSKVIRMNARSPQEQVVVGRGFRNAVLGVWVMVALLLTALLFGGDALTRSPWIMAIGISAWTAVLLGLIFRTSTQLEKNVARIRVETRTTDAEYAPLLDAKGMTSAGPRRYESRWRFLGLPVFAFASGGLDTGAFKSRWARGWIAVGDLAISPLLAIGGFAMAPIAIGGATVGLVSLSFLGVAVGVLALGSLAAGWWAIGFVAVAWKGAAGLIAIAHDFAVGQTVRAAEANTLLAVEWFRSQWFVAPSAIFLAVIVPVVIVASIVVPAVILARRGWLLRRPLATVVPHAEAVPQADRLHGLDALRGVALLLGLVLHAAMPYLLPSGAWAVGTSTPVPFLGWLVYYLHSFRLEVFFLIAGFFGATIVGTRGVGTWLRQRARRLLLVFVLALYPMKVLLSAVWISGGRATGWLELPPAVASLPLWVMSLGAPFQEPWPHIGLTHLWFLYYLAIISVLVAAARWIALRAGVAAVLSVLADRVLRPVLASGWAPLGLALITTPILATMSGMDVDTPDRSLVWHWPVIALYGWYFVVGWVINARRDLLDRFAAHWRLFVVVGVLVSLVTVVGVATRYAPGPWATANADLLRWMTSFGTSLTMAASVLGWIGAFVARLNRPSRVFRFMADASYWVYVAHLPLMVALQVWWSGSGLPWWVQMPLVFAGTLVPLLLTYYFYARLTRRGGLQSKT